MFLYWCAANYVYKIDFFDVTVQSSLNCFVKQPLLMLLSHKFGLKKNGISRLQNSASPAG